MCSPYWLHACCGSMGCAGTVVPSMWTCERNLPLSVQILTPMQLARCAIEVYPYHQDVFAIVDLIAMQACAQHSCYATEVYPGSIKDVHSAHMSALMPAVL